MNRIITAFTFAAALFTFAGISAQTQKKPNQAPPIPINFGKDATKGQDRFLEYVKVVSPNCRTIEQKDLPKDQAYFNFAIPRFTIGAVPGAEIQFEYKWSGTWMDSYLYLDRNQNKKFDVTSMEDNELVYATVYNGQKKTKNGVEQTGDKWKVNFQNGTFTAPSKPGEYHLRFKIDWNNIDPGGNTDAKNEIVKNRGNIVDFVLYVYDPKDLDTGYYIGMNYELNVTHSNNGNFATMIVPYPVRIPQGVHAYKLRGEPSASAINFELIESKVIPANTAVFIIADKPGKYTCPAVACADDPIETHLYGTTETLTPAMRDQANFKYYVLVDNKQGNTEFRQIQKYNIPANRCYLKIPVGTAAPVIHFELPKVVEPTAVTKVASDNNGQTGATYNLAGQRIDATTAKGVVIRNGKKVFVP